ncbi:c-type cytochrome [Membranihabitans maritimus]|uniref:c-type cytochrome n=1 Tax=Membranihabitans maritimus TaxID=2904244 RepID=UPI001F29B21D|nr:cytochrome c [Membranihabitans maritimus]
MKRLFLFLCSAMFFLLMSCGSEGDSGNSGESTKTETKKEETKEETTDMSGSDVPASKRVVLDNKGVGPVENVDIPEDIDRKLAVEGKEIYDTKCIACHAVDRKVIGPPQKGVLERRSPEWVMNMIMNPTEMLEKDPLAKELLKEFNNSPMLDQNISREEARALLEYFRTL